MASAYETAQKEVNQLNSKPTPQEMLELYSHFKVGNNEDFSKAPKAGMFEFERKHKNNAWKELLDQGVTPEQAQAKYVELVEGLKQKYGFDPNKDPDSK